MEAIRMLDDTDRRFMDIAYSQALKSFQEGGIPIGSALARGQDLIAAGHNRRVQHGDPIAHGEMDCLRTAGRQSTYRDLTLYTTLSPCMMCSGTTVQFKIRRVVIGENRTFGGNEDFMRSFGAEVLIAEDERCYRLMQDFIRQQPDLWMEDIAE
jgi:creatinine deaminase